MINRLARVTLRSSAFKSVGTYTLSNFLTKAISFASLPFFTYVLTKNDFGAIAIFSSSINFLMPFLALGVLYSTSTDFFKLSKPEFASFIKTTTPLPLAMMLLSMLVFYVFFPFFKNIGFHYSFIFLVPVITYFNFLFEQNITLLRNNNEVKKYLLLTVGKTLIELVLAFGLIWIFHLGWGGRVTGIMAAFLFCAIFAWVYIIRNGYFKGSFQWKIVRQEMVFTLPALATQFSIIFLNASDRYFINSYLGSERTGVYSLAATFASVIFIFNSALLQYVFPRLYASFAKNEFGKVIRTIFLKYIFLIIGVSLALLMLTWVSYHYFLNPDFLPGLKYFYILLVGYILWAVTYFFYSILLYFKQKRKMTLLAVVSVGVSATIMNTLVANYNESGAAWAVVLSYAFMLLFTLMINFKRIRDLFIARS